jgi:type II secretion system protein N
MSRLRLTLLACAVGLVAFVIGLRVYFPGAALSRYAAQQAQRALGMPVRLSPIHPGLTGIGADTLDLVPPNSRPVTIQDVRVPWTWRLFTGLPLSARIGTDGSAELSWGWGGDLEWSLSRVALQDLPLGVFGPDIQVQGRVDASGRAGPLKTGGAREMPPGKLDLRADSVQVTGVKVAGTAVPPVHLDVVEVHLVLGRTVQVESASVRGDAQGTVTGTIVPNLDRPADSRLSLNITMQVQRTWMDGLGDLKPLAQAALPDGRIEGTLEGTLAAPTLSRTQKRS